jgi:hypothetical protein
MLVGQESLRYFASQRERILYPIDLQNVRQLKEKLSTQCQILWGRHQIVSHSVRCDFHLDLDPISLRLDLSMYVNKSPIPLMRQSLYGDRLG